MLAYQIKHHKLAVQNELSILESAELLDSSAVHHVSDGPERNNAKKERSDRCRPSGCSGPVCRVERMSVVAHDATDETAKPNARDKPPAVGPHLCRSRYAFCLQAVEQ